MTSDSLVGGLLVGARKSFPGLEKAPSSDIAPLSMVSQTCQPRSQNILFISDLPMSQRWREKLSTHCHQIMHCKESKALIQTMFLKELDLAESTDLQICLGNTKAPFCFKYFYFKVSTLLVKALI